MIYIDKRAGSRELMKYLAPGTAELTHLQFGDAMFLGNGPEGVPVHVGLELKTVSDILQCLLDGRFSGHQLPGLQSHYHVIYLIIEGYYRPEPVTGWLKARAGRFGTKHWQYRDLDCYLTTLEMRAGVRVRRTYDRAESAELVASQYHWWTIKDYEEHRSHEAFDNSGGPTIRPSLLRRMAAQLPGIGWHKAQAVEQHFPDIVSMVLADAKEWRKIEGIGKTLSLRVVDELQKQKSRWAR